MRRSNAESIADALRRYLRQEGLETPLNERRAIAVWPEVMGLAIARYTGDVFVKNGVMYVQITSPALRANLMMARASIVHRINDAVGAQVVESIVFR
ncbi:MAG: DUF721 domain-containing protein [Paraprevotella sp.]|nr:DUF721 domain-containing protein [Paraprevotella sp.]